MTEKHNCNDNSISKTITVIKIIDDDIHDFLVRGKCCKICNEIVIHSDELKILEKRIKAYEELMSIVTSYREGEKL